MEATQINWWLINQYAAKRLCNAWKDMHNVYNIYMYINKEWVYHLENSSGTHTFYEFVYLKSLAEKAHFNGKIFLGDGMSSFGTQDSLHFICQILFFIHFMRFP